MIITTARKPLESLEQEAGEIALTYGIPFVPRGNTSLEDLISSNDYVLLLSRERLSCHTKAGEFFLHPNMAAVRIKLLRQGVGDKMLDVMELKPGDSVLDCTAGLCADSMVARYRVGEGGRVTALEKSLPIFIVVKHGLDNYPGPSRFRELAEGIQLVRTDFRDYLAGLPAESYDVVYFDPMFDVPVLKTSALVPLRPLAWHQPLTVEDIQAAARVARKKVVVKQRSFYDFFGLGLIPASGGQNRKIAYGVIDKRSNE